MWVWPLRILIPSFVAIFTLPIYHSSATGAQGNLVDTSQMAVSVPSCRVYAAGPYGFTESTRRFMQEDFYGAIRNAGCEVIDPWRHDPKDYKTLIELGKLNADDIRWSHGVVAALDGSDIDSGTAAEIGYAAGLKKWIIGYRDDLRMTGEGKDVQINLQVQYFIEKLNEGKGKIVNNLPDLTKEICRITGGTLVRTGNESQRANIPITCKHRK